MNAKPVVFRAVADRDVVAIIDYYAGDIDADTALNFVDALNATTVRIGKHPKLGSPRYADLLNMPGLRNRKLQRFPYLLFYLERTNHIDVWRVLHSARDIPEWLATDDELRH